ncbi:MAG: desulfoferrodoxin family protein [Bradymonadales bacterium]
MTKMTFCLCKHCGNLVGLINNAGVPLVCCGENMEVLAENTVDASNEKHIPVVKRVDGKIRVEVGSILHPMIPEHLIEWVYIQTSKGGHRKNLVAGEQPIVEFALVDEELVAAYAYCNLHGLWKSTE